MASEATTTDPPITETIDSSSSSSSSSSGGVDDIVETLYNSDNELIGYACKQILEKNTVEEMDLLFYMDVRTPIGEAGGAPEQEDAATTSSTPQETAIAVAQEMILREMSQEYQIDPEVSRGVRCFDLPVDGSTWIVEMTIEKREFKEVTLFGTCCVVLWRVRTSPPHQRKPRERRKRLFFKWC